MQSSSGGIARRRTRRPARCPAEPACGEHRVRAASRRGRASLSDRPHAHEPAREGRRRAGLLAMLAELLEQRRRRATVRAGKQRRRRRRSAGPWRSPATPRGDGPKAKGRYPRCAQQAARPLCPHYRSRRVSRRNARGYGPRRPLTKTAGIPVICRRSAGDTAVVRALLVGVRRRESRLRHTGSGRYSGLHLPCFSELLVVLGGARGCSRLQCAARDARSQAKEQVDFGIKVAQNGLWKEAIVPLEEGGRDRPDLRRRLEQPGDRLRARRALRGGRRRPTRRPCSSIRRT